METMVYGSKVDAWIIILVLCSLAIAVVPVILLKVPASVKWLVVAISAVVLIFVLCATFGIRYEIAGDELTVKNGLGSKSVYDIHTIKSIRPTNNALSSPAASLDRLEIKFTDSNEVLRISPKDKQGFIDHICQINANVVVLKK